MASEQLAIRIGGRLPMLGHGGILIFVDEGQAVASDYMMAAEIALERVPAHPGGLGCLVIIPGSARPPSELARRAIKTALGKVTPHLRGMCWVVEGSGFRAATLRAALAGLGLFIAAPHPTFVAKDMVDGLGWILKQLDPAAAPSRLVSVAVSVEQGLQELALR